MNDPIATRDEARMLKHALSNRGRYVAGVSQARAWERFVTSGLAEAVPPRRPHGLTVYRLTGKGAAYARDLAKGRA